MNFCRLKAHRFNLYIYIYYWGSEKSIFLSETSIVICDSRQTATDLNQVRMGDKYVQEILGAISRMRAR